MPVLNLELRGAPAVNAVPLPVRVVDSELRTVERRSVSLGATTAFSLSAPDRYAVFVDLPSGIRLQAACDFRNAIDGDEQTVRIELPPLDLGTGEPNPPAARALAWTRLSKPQALAPREWRERQRESTWVRLWEQHADGEWVVAPWRGEAALHVSEAGLVHYELSLRRPTYLQIGGARMPWRLVALPPENVRVMIKAAESPPDPELAPEYQVYVTLETESQRGDTLLRYIRRGAIGDARVLGEALFEELLQGHSGVRAEHRSPFELLVVGYFLLQADGEPGNRARLDLWFLSWLESGLPDLPDVGVIRAWNELYNRMGRNKEDRSGRAQKSLLAAARRGVPMLPVGVRLLVDGLQLFTRPDETPNADVEDALRRMRRYLSALEWDTATTTFLGERPDELGLPPRGRGGGIPDDRDNLHFISESPLAEVILRLPQWRRDPVFEPTMLTQEPLGGKRFGRTRASSTAPGRNRTQ